MGDVDGQQKHLGADDVAWHHGTPLVGIASAAILLDEPLDLSLAVAAGLIVTGIGLATLGDRLLRGQATASG
ncbi:hypothetical protein SAMN05216573_11072 [Bradyrhizobium sp. Rc3b]|nr:drug/metabolite transporter (DMT)-like permease [Bradyrhizobium sp. SBR1B]SFN24575.1 hypothetical protein SAMN05216573_11072 [Bradyrhizobium sp. Rc3b]